MPIDTSYLRSDHPSTSPDNLEFEKSHTEVTARIRTSKKLFHEKMHQKIIEHLMGVGP